MKSNLRIIRIFIFLYLLMSTSLALSQEVSMSSGIKLGIESATLQTYIQLNSSVRCVLSRHNSIIDEPVELVSDGVRIVFNGFNFSVDGYNSKEFSRLSSQVIINKERECLIVHEILQHPMGSLKVEVTTNVTVGEGTIHFHIHAKTSETNRNVDSIGIGDHVDKIYALKRLYFRSNGIIENPIAFEGKAKWGYLPFMGMEFENDIFEIVSMDLMPGLYRVDPSIGRYDLRIYSEPDVKYTIALSARSFNDVISRYRKTLGISAPETLSIYPGRSIFMAPRNLPLKDSKTQWLLKDLVGRGAMGFLYLSYGPVEGDRSILHSIDPTALYGYYDQYVDWYDPNSAIPKQFHSPDWDKKLATYDENGNLVRGWKNCARILPQLYVKYSTNRKQALHHRSNPDDKIFNLELARDLLKPQFVYMDVHGGSGPYTYWDYTGKQFSQREFINHTKALFDFTRKYLGGVPVISEGGGAWLAGSMDGGAFNGTLYHGPGRTPGTGRNSKWAYYPFVEQVYRGIMQHWSVGNHGVDYTEQVNDPNSEFRKRIALNVLHGRNELLPAYTMENLNDNTFRLFMYYLTAGLTKGLGLSAIESVEFYNNDIEHQIIIYQNGTQVWVNQSEKTWTVNGYRLPKWGYLVLGPHFLQYRVLDEDTGGIVDFVNNPDYIFASSQTEYDFGIIKIKGGAVSIRRHENTIKIFEIIKPKGNLLVRPADMGIKILKQVRCHVIRLKDNIEVKEEIKACVDVNGEISLDPVEGRDVLRYEITYAT